MCRWLRELPERPLRHFAIAWQGRVQQSARVIGFCCDGFDLPSAATDDIGASPSGNSSSANSLLASLVLGEITMAALEASEYGLVALKANLAIRAHLDADLDGATGDHPSFRCDRGVDTFRLVVSVFAEPSWTHRPSMEKS
jgi:hypothetical protein